MKPAWGGGKKLTSALNGAVMRRFARVVALPDPKFEFLQPNQHFHRELYAHQPAIFVTKFRGYGSS